MKDTVLFASSARPPQEKDIELLKHASSLKSIDKIVVFISPKTTQLTQSAAHDIWAAHANEISPNKLEIIPVSADQKSPVTAAYQYAKDLTHFNQHSRVLCLTHDKSDKRFASMIKVMAKENGQEGVAERNLRVVHYSSDDLRRAQQDIAVAATIHPVTHHYNTRARARFQTAQTNAAQALVELSQMEVGNEAPLPSKRRVTFK